MDDFENVDDMKNKHNVKNVVNICNLEIWRLLGLMDILGDGVTDI